MTYEMIQSTLTLVIEAAVCSLPIIWLHYLWSSGRCPTTVRDLSERCPKGIRSLSENNTFGVREEFVEHLLEQPIQIPDFQPLSREAVHEREQVSEKLSERFHSDSESIAVEHSSNSERISSDILTKAPARTVFGQPVEQSWLNRVKRYQLHGYEVVKVADLMIQLPAGVKRYRLRSQAVVRVQDLIAAQ